jgi:hypothetical protein
MLGAWQGSEEFLRHAPLVSAKAIAPNIVLSTGAGPSTPEAQLSLRTASSLAASTKRRSGADRRATLGK